ncbi:uncharacterized protein LOC133645974 [Entelurus aequoreus]|uniref:uncharacterized protein LOC133645974 n=1 Tax=Entelurus aequoreus TaxID=161455 RepID=UPI002B1E71E5|nr:uncharacterized protein LOC133645974 [Entelurus aequoreus]
MTAPQWTDKNLTIGEDDIKIVFLVANCLILSATSVAGTAANVFVVLAVCNQKSLRTWNNALLVNLAAVDIFRCASDCPVLLAVVLLAHRRGGARPAICAAQSASFSFCCCVQLLTLACISAERYQAVARPFKSAERKKRVLVLIPLTWTLALLVAAVCLMFAKDSPVQVRCKGSPHGEASSNDTFGTFILFPLWVACFGVIIGFYARIFALLREHNRKIFDKGVLPVPKNEEKIHHNESRRLSIGVGNELRLKVLEMRAEPHPSVDLLARKSLKAERLKLSLVEPSDGALAVGVKSSITKPDKPPGNCGAEKQPGSGVTADGTPCEVKVKATSLRVCTSPLPRNDPPSEAGDSAVPGERALVSDDGPETATIEGAVCIMPPKAAKERKSRKKESKMAKRAGYIIVTFLFFWLPLIVTIVINFLLHHNTKVHTQGAAMREVELLSVSVACVSSLSNPIIYAAVNPQFGAEFERLKNTLRSSLVCR